MNFLSSQPHLLERCPSGLRSTLGKRVYAKVYRGFESLSLRKNKKLCSQSFLCVIFETISVDLLSYFLECVFKKSEAIRVILLEKTEYI